MLSDYNGTELESTTERLLKNPPAMKSGPSLPQLEKALAQKRRPNTANK